MKTTISESKLNAIISESIKKVLKESYFDFESMQEAPKENNSNKDNDSEDKDVRNKRNQVISALKKDGTDCSPYAYKLWPNKDKDTARGYFFKCLNGTKNDSGYPYQFDDSEINRLYSMLSSDAI